MASLTLKLALSRCAHKDIGHPARLGLHLDPCEFMLLLQGKKELCMLEE